ncbi:dUTP diphosphatase [Desulfovibrio sp. OttesenSCG-928-G15]|nr:dUTP diphosphatase [Desulfovibrio sp. OttesenSCG-928-G15]
MTSVSALQAAVGVFFFRDALSLYTPDGLRPATFGSAGTDLRACLEDTELHVDIPPGERRCLPSGIAIEPQTPGIAGFIYSRSGLGAVTGLTVAQGVGVIDPDYRGEIKVFLLNTSSETQRVNKGDRIAQLIFQPFAYPAFHTVTELGATKRGEGGFGHTGKL